MENKNTVRMNKDGRLVIMQVSDPQDMKYVRKAMVKMLDKAYDTVKPDLVLFTGDNILGNHLLDARFGSRKIAEGKEATLDIMRDSLHHICVPLEKRGIPFAMIYGNHDDMNLVTKEEQIEFYRSYSKCLPMNDSGNGVDCDTYNIPVLSSDGSKTVFNLWMLDSAWHDKNEDKCYSAIKPEAVEWYKETSAKLKAENGGENVPSLMFMHIPLKEINEFVEPCCPSDEGAKKLVNDPIGGWKRLKPDMAQGHLGEAPCVLDDDSGLFEAIKENGDVKAVVFGHDHCNSFTGRYQGVDFIQTACASFRCYGNMARGVRIFVIDENNPDAYETYTLNYFDICGDSLPAKILYYRDADEYEKKRFAVYGAVAASALIGAASAIIKNIRK